MSVIPLKIDIHTHILPESWPDLRARYTPAPRELLADTPRATLPPIRRNAEL